MVGMRQSIRRFTRDESGFAMITVLGVGIILFILLSTTIAITNYRTMQTTRYQSRTRAVQTADAGLNEFLYQMSIVYTFAGPVTGTLSDGSTYVVTRTNNADGTVTVTSVTTLTDGTHRTVKAVVSPPHFADYAIGSTVNITVGPETIIDGPVRTNGYIAWTSGGTKSWIMGKSQSPVAYYVTNGSNLTASTDLNHFKGGIVPVGSVAQLNFDSISTDIDGMKANAGLLLPDSATIDSSAKGYEIVLNNNQVTVSLVMSENASSTSSAQWGKLTTKSPTTYAIPSNGVIFVQNDNVWVKGTYTSRVTICASRTSSSDLTNSGCITVENSVLCGNISDSKITCGLLAQNSIWLPSWYSRTDATPAGVMDPILTIQSAMLAQNGSIADGFTGSGRSISTGSATKPQPEHDLYITGASVGKGGIGFTSPTNVGTSNQTYGFLNRNYGFDPRLTTNPPPSWPKTGDSVVIASWVAN